MDTDRKKIKGMANLSRWHRELVMAMLCSAVIVVVTLAPYLIRPEIGLSHKYRGLLILVSVLASPLIDLLTPLSERWFLTAAAALTWAANSLAFFIVLGFIRLLRQLATNRTKLEGSPN